MAGKQRFLMTVNNRLSIKYVGAFFRSPVPLSSFLKLTVVAEAVEEVGIPPLLRDFQAQGESPALGLFLGAASSTAFLPTDSAIEPDFPQPWQAPLV